MRLRTILASIFTIVASAFAIAVFATLGLAIVGAGAAGAVFALIYTALKGGKKPAEAPEEAVIYGPAPADS